MLFLLATIVVRGQGIKVTAALDSINILMGKLSELHIEVVKDKSQQGDLTLFKQNNSSSPYVTVCGDSVELSRSFKTDTVEIGSGRIQINYAIPMQVFDSGTYRLPSFVYVSGWDSAFSNQVSFNIVPVNVTADDPISGFTNVFEPEGKRFYDALPDFIFDFWWIFILVVAAIIAFLWGYNKYKSAGGIKMLVPQKVETPYESAIRQLAELKARKLWEQGMEKEYFTELTDILRVYLERRFGIYAMEMTTKQIIDTLKESDVKDKRSYIHEILKIADFVKFAKVRPLPADNISAFDNAVKFVEETKPVPQTETMSQSEKGGEV